MSAVEDAIGVIHEDDTELSPRQTTPSMRGAMESLGSSLGSLDGRADPDAQATVTDFLEFTEHLPADMMRSLTLIGKLDRDYADASTRLHELAKSWGQLPLLPTDEKPQPVKLRGEISEELNNVMTTRIYSHAEAVRMAENVKRHVNRLKLIHAKLRVMLDNYPAEDEVRSPVALTRSPQASRGNKRQPAGGEKGRRPRGPRITVPGEVLAPFDVGYDTGSSSGDSSDEEEEEGLGHGRTAAAQSGNQKSRGRKVPEKTPKAPKLKISKTITQVPIPNTAVPAVPAEPVQLRPPPPDAPVGSDDAPWFQLTQYELARLRKRMKKNAAWVPSDTMINRELKVLGRGYDGWTSAKKKAEDTGMPFEPTLPQLIVDDATGSEHLPMGAVSLDSAMAAEDRNLTNRGIDLNKAKKLKKDRLSDQAAKEAEESARQIARIARDLQVSFQQPQPSSQPQTKNTKRQQKKRKRDSVSEADAEKPDLVILKRSKTETPVPIPRHISMPRHNTLQPSQVAPTTIQIPQSTTPVPIPIHGHDHSIMVGAKSSSATSPAASTDTGTTTTVGQTKTLSSDSSSSKKSTTPILPPVRETRAREAKAKEMASAPPPIKATNSRGNTPSVTSPGLELPSRRPSSRGTTAGQEAGQQMGLAAERSRRTSTARNTPAPDVSLRQPSKRIKRPAPGIISRTNSGGNNSAITKRKAAPRKSKRGSQKKERGQTTETEAEVEVDEEGNVIDPNEARYCFCNRVSFGTMVMCENDSCKYEWFHLECLGLNNAAGLAKTWYCSDCRAQQGPDEKADGGKRTTRRGA